MIDENVPCGDVQIGVRVTGSGGQVRWAMIDNASLDPANAPTTRASNALNRLLRKQTPTAPRARRRSRPNIV